MPLAVHVSASDVRVPVSFSQARGAAERVLRAEKIANAAVDITFVTSRKMAALNWKHLRHRGSTDVISFGFDAIGGAPLTGDIYIAPEVAKRNAAAAGDTYRAEILRLVIHGVLHVIGHEHPVDEARYRSPMWRRQEALLRRVMSS